MVSNVNAGASLFMLPNNLARETHTSYQTHTDHNESNPNCLIRDKLWQDLQDYIADAISSANPAAIALLKSTSLVAEHSAPNVKSKLCSIRTHLSWLRRAHDKYIGHLMLDTMQSLKHFEMRDEVSQSHLLQHSDYMMKLRPLMKHESGADFHMIMNKGDSVLVSGFSFVGTDAQMQALQTEAGDAMIHHVVTVGGDTTQGGLFHLS